MITADDLLIAPIFSSISRDEREHIAKHAAELFFNEGDWVVREGEAPWFFILLEGRLHIEKEYGASSRTELVYSPGDFHGETPIVLNSAVVESLRADAPSRVARLDRTQCLDLIASSSVCRDLIFQVMMTRIGRMQMRVKEALPVRVTIYAPLFDAQCRQVRSFLSMNRIPFDLQTASAVGSAPTTIRMPRDTAWTCRARRSRRWCFRGSFGSAVGQKRARGTSRHLIPDRGLPRVSKWHFRRRLNGPLS